MSYWEVNFGGSEHDVPLIRIILCILISMDNQLALKFYRMALFKNLLYTIKQCKNMGYRIKQMHLS